PSPPPTTPPRYPPSLHDALPISLNPKLASTWIAPPELATSSRIAGWNLYMNASIRCLPASLAAAAISSASPAFKPIGFSHRTCRSEEHTSELQSRVDLVCRLLLE